MAIKELLISSMPVEGRKIIVRHSCTYHLDRQSDTSTEIPLALSITGRLRYLKVEILQLKIDCWMFRQFHRPAQPSEHDTLVGTD